MSRAGVHRNHKVTARGRVAVPRRLLKKAADLFKMVLHGHGDSIEDVLQLQTMDWPPAGGTATMTSFANFDLRNQAFWKGAPPNIDVSPISRGIIASTKGLDTDP